MGILETELVRLRALEPEDVEVLYDWENRTDIWSVSNTTTPFSRHVLRRFIDNQQLDIYATRQLRLVVESKKTMLPVGCIDLFDLDPHNSRAGIGVLIADPGDRQQGYASAALDALAEYCFSVLDLHQLYANTGADNTRSLELFLGKGFTLSGIKTGWNRTPSGWQDEHMLQLLNPRKT